MSNQPVKWRFEMQGETMSMQTVNVSVTVNSVTPPSPFTVVDASGNPVPDGGAVTMPDETVGSQVNDTIVTLSGGTPPYTESVTSGQPPDGVTVQATVNGDGSETVTLTGTPTTAGDSSFALQVSDSAGVKAQVKVKKATTK